MKTRCYTGLTLEGTAFRGTNLQSMYPTRRVATGTFMESHNYRGSASLARFRAPQATVSHGVPRAAVQAPRKGPSKCDTVSVCQKDVTGLGNGRFFLVALVLVRAFDHRNA